MGSKPPMSEKAMGISEGEMTSDAIIPSVC
jgi:hypothetical protein